jgi:hypothetical protein
LPIPDPEARIQIFFHPGSRIKDLGTRGQKSTGSRIPDPGFRSATSTDKLAYRSRQKKKNLWKNKIEPVPGIFFLYTQYILPPCSLHSRPYCVQVQPTDETSVKSVGLYFLFPPKWATIPVTAEGLLYLTLDRRRDAGRVETKVRYFSFFAKFKIYAVVSHVFKYLKKFPTFVFITVLCLQKSSRKEVVITKSLFTYLQLMTL